ncbi:MAG: hypothetical protein ACLQF4_00500 [Xanthobacteraceae bacterium]
MTKPDEPLAPDRPAEDHARRQLALFAVRCDQVAERVAAGALPIVEGVDLLYSAAIWSGLVDGVGDDEVQRTMADAFLRTRRGAP